MKNTYFILVLCFILSTSTYGQFGPEKEITESTSGISTMMSFDLDNDGDLDILSEASSVGKIIWYENTDGLGNFELQIASNDGNSASNIYAADLDSDGDLDILTTSYWLDNVSWYENNGDGTFGNRQEISNETNGANYVFAFDLDSDNDLDVLVGSAFDTNITWFENTDGSGNFGPQQVIDADFDGMYGIYACDIDGDDDIDVLAASCTDDKVVWYENNGTGEFGSEQIITINADYAVAVFADDMDGDGDMDVLSGSRFDDKIAWYENDGTGNFSSEQVISLYAYSALAVYAGDLNGDGDVDVLSASLGAERLVWYENDGSPNFSIQHLVSDTVYSPNDIFFCDFDNDGNKDILASFAGNYEGSQYSNSQVIWYRNLGLGQFSDKQVISSELERTSSVFACDLDGDGDAEAISGSLNDNKLAWYENTDGLGTFGAQQLIDAEIDRLVDVCAEDIDGDGDIDLLTASNEDDKVAWYANDGNGNFGEQQIISTSSTNPYFIIIADIDLDGDPDVIYPRNEEYYLLCSKNEGNGTFSEAEGLIAIPENDYSTWNNFETSDLDLDGDLDLVASFYESSRIVWFENDGTGNFGEQQIISTNGTWESVDATACDIDLDGDIDVIAATNSGSLLVWYENDGTQNFSSANEIAANSVYALFNIDIDNDGDSDLFIASDNINVISWYENYTNGAPSSIEASVFYDANQNGEQDSLEYGLAFLELGLNPNELISFSDDQGQTKFYVDSGQYILSYETLDGWDLTTDSAEYHVLFEGNDFSENTYKFGLFPSSIYTEIIPSLNANPIPCSTSGFYFLNHLNQSTINPSGIIELILDSLITFESSSLTPDSIVGQSMYWHFDTLNYYELGQINAIVTMPDFTFMGDTIISILNITNYQNEEAFFYSDTLNDIITCSYDPNDKMATPRGEGDLGIIEVDETLEYMVRFQNTGNAEATTVKVWDEISENLDLNTFEIIAASHNVQTYIQQNRWLIFQFDSIMLPDSTSNELESHGFVKFRIRPNADVLPNAIITNSAQIYFDSNPAVLTNTVLNTIECYMTPEVPEISQTNDTLWVNSENEILWFLNEVLINDATDSILTITENGNYAVMVYDENGCFSESELLSIINVNMDKLGSSHLEIFPNPSSGIFTVKGQNIELIEVFNNKGVQLVSCKESNIDLSLMDKGIYFIKVTSLNSVITRKLILK